MNKKTSIFISEVKFDSFTNKNLPMSDDDLFFLSYEGEDEFKVDDDFGGIAAMITVVNTNHRKHPMRGARRRVLLSLIDCDDDSVVTTRLLSISIPKTECVFFVYQGFDAEANNLCAGHSYRLTFEDTGAGVKLGEYGFSLLGEDNGTLYRLPEDTDFDHLLDEFIASQYGDENEVEEQEQEQEPEEIKPAEPEPLSLKQMTGLRAVKEKLDVYERVVRFNKMRADSGLPLSPTPLHAMFLGSPGTGKTTVAKMMGEMLQRAGMLSRGHVVVRERSNLIGYHYNSEGENTLKAIEEARGGILFIDEAYQLYQPQDPRDPGKFVIETLLTSLADPDMNDWMLILAGYPDEMRRMFDMNPGFKSRIPTSNIYCFEDFCEEELMEIACKYLSRHSYSLTPEAADALAVRLNDDYEHRDRTFGNARHVISLIQTQILPAMAVRVTDAGDTCSLALTQIEASDIPSPMPAPTAPGRVGFRI